MGRTATLRKLLSMHKCVLFFIAFAIVLFYMQLSNNPSVLHMDVIQPSRVVKLISKYSKQNRKPLVFPNKTTKNDYQPGEIQTNANIRYGLRPYSGVEQPLTNLSEWMFQRRHVTMPSEKEPVDVKQRKTAQQKTVDVRLEVDRYPTYLSENNTRTTIHWGPVTFPHISHFHRNGYHGIDLMKVPTYPFDPGYKNPCWTESGLLRCLPYFFIIGVMKCGTSELWKKIDEHPDFVRPSFVKEAQWFATRRFQKGEEKFDAYINMFQSVALEIQYTKKITFRKHLITGEASPSNLYFNSHWRYLPGNEKLDEPRYVILDYIHHFLPEAKIIIIFRDPVDRLYSEYYHQFNKYRPGFPTSPEHFHELVHMGLQLYKKCLQKRTIRSCVYDERIYCKVGIMIQLGIYHVFWQELTRLFQPDQLLVLQNKDLRDGSDLLSMVYSFLEMRPFQNDFQNDTKSNTRREVDAAKGGMLSETRKLLRDFYQPHNEEMFRITGDEIFLYFSTPY